VLIFGSLLAVLLKMRTRWRLADERREAGKPGEEPETDTPYGPRSRPPAADVLASRGAGSGADGDGLS
jgi:cytochrome bd ubiquinol oxidase subunit I